MNASENKAAFKLDAPITCKEQDLLGMASSAVTLAQFCLSQDGSSSFAVGIYGEWGSGKTSFVSLVKESLLEMTKDLPDSKQPILFSFDPWACDPSDSMLRRFLSELSSALSKGPLKVKKAKDIAFKLKEYADAAAPIVPVPGVMDIASAALGSYAESGTTVASLKNNVSKRFKKLGKRVFVFIDDLDRLPDEQIRAVFQLVNHTASFSNIVYILAFDHNVVAAALDGTQFGTGANYIRKIIQVAYSVPRFNRATILNYFLEQVEPYFEAVPMHDFDRMRFYQMQNIVLSPALCSLREAKRILNTFDLNCATVSKELDLTDVLALSVIEVADPLLYTWIHENKELVCLPDYRSAIDKDYSAKYDESVRVSLSNLYKNGQIFVDEAFDKLKHLFPKVSKHGQSVSAETSRSYRRVSSPAYFDLYFSSNTESVVVPKADIESLIHPVSEDAVHTILARAAESNQLIDLLEELRCHENRFSLETLAMLVKPLFNMFGKSSESPRGILTLDADTRIRFMLNDILRKLGMSKADSLVEPLLTDLDDGRLVGLSAWINDFEIAYGRLAAAEEKPYDQLISLETLERMERAFVDRAPEYAHNGDILRRKRAGTFLYLWHSLDEQSFVSFWTSALSQADLFSAYLVLACSGEWVSSATRGWRCSDDLFEGLVSRDLIVLHLLNLKGTRALANFTDEELCKLISYIEGGPDVDMDRYYTEDDALQHLPEWRVQAS